MTRLIVSLIALVFLVAPGSAVAPGKEAPPRSDGAPNVRPLDAEAAERFGPESVRRVHERLEPRREGGLRLYTFPDETDLTDADLAAVQAFDDVREVYLTGSFNGDECLRNLAGLQTLEVLTLHAIPVTDDGLSHLGRLPHIRTFRCHCGFHSSVTRAGLVHLVALTELENLTLGGHLEDETLATLKDLRGLRTLVLWSRAVSPAGWGFLRGLSSLEGLTAGHVTDEAGAAFTELRELKSLELTGPRPGTSELLGHFVGLN